MDPITQNKADQAAIYNLYLYLAHLTTPSSGDSLRSISENLAVALHAQPSNEPTARVPNQLRILQRAVSRSPTLADSVIGNLTYAKQGLTACTFTDPNGSVFVVFRGAGSGEWIDNGEGLSGIPEPNTYITYDQNGTAQTVRTVQIDYATDQQVEALNWFHRIAAENGWDTTTDLTVSGHSKGGNKAQFITMHSQLVDRCFSFDGQGFSPEAIRDLRKRFGADFEPRRQKLYSLSADNDYINVLGDRLVPPAHVYFLQSVGGWHPLEAILDESGNLRPLCEQGELSQYIQSVSDELMRIRPLFRRYATLGIMNIFQKYLGAGVPVNADAVSTSETIAGIAVAIGAVLQALP